MLMQTLNESVRVLSAKVMSMQETFDDRFGRLHSEHILLKNKVSFIERNARFDTPYSATTGAAFSQVLPEGDAAISAGSPFQVEEDFNYRRGVHPVSGAVDVASPRRSGGVFGGGGSSGGGPVTREGAPLVGILRKKEELDKSLRGGYREAPGTGREQPVDDGGKSTEEFIERIKHRFEETHQMLFRMDQPGAGQH